MMAGLLVVEKEREGPDFGSFASALPPIEGSRSSHLFQKISRKLLPGHTSEMEKFSWFVLRFSALIEHPHFLVTGLVLIVDNGACFFHR